MCTIDRRKEPGKFDTIINPCTSYTCAFYFCNMLSSRRRVVAWPSYKAFQHHRDVSDGFGMKFRNIYGTLWRNPLYPSTSTLIYAHNTIRYAKTISVMLRS